MFSWWLESLHSCEHYCALCKDLSNKNIKFYFSQRFTHNNNKNTIKSFDNSPKCEELRYPCYYQTNLSISKYASQIIHMYAMSNATHVSTPNKTYFCTVYRTFYRSIQTKIHFYTTFIIDITANYYQALQRREKKILTSIIFQMVLNIGMPL